MGNEKECWQEISNTKGKLKVRSEELRIGDIIRSNSQQEYAMMRGG